MENLNVDKFRNGDIIPEAKTNAEWSDANTNKTPAWCYYDNDPTNGEKHGKLYNWYAVNDSRGLAPTGYKIPTIKELMELEFKGLTGGYRNNDGRFCYIGSYGYWWSSSEYNTTSAWFRYLDYDDDAVDRNYGTKGSGLSVICINETI